MHLRRTVPRPRARRPLRAARARSRPRRGPRLLPRAERKLGATARFSGRSAADGPVTVRLEPCGTARARLVAPDGKPLDAIPRPRPDLDGRHPGAAVPAEPGEGRPPVRRGSRRGPARPGQLTTTDLQSDAQGRVTFPALIPGASYRILDLTPLPTAASPVIRKEFTVKPGETVDLGDILIAKPQRRN